MKVSEIDVVWSDLQFVGAQFNLRLMFYSSKHWATAVKSKILTVPSPLTSA